MVREVAALELLQFARCLMGMSAMVGERRSCHKGALLDPADSPVIVVVTRDGTKDAANSSRVPVEVEVASKHSGAGWVRLEAWVDAVDLCLCVRPHQLAVR